LTGRDEVQKKMMLEVKGLHVEIHGKPILDGLDLTVKAGEVAAIMGPNGSGKSTLSYVIAGKADYEVTAGEGLVPCFPVPD
jgi:Fe-S cluster assembly ATP-binding protein